MNTYEKLFSTNARGMKRSEIRELLKLTQKPDIISFAGGLPAPELFPVEKVKEVTDYVLDNEGKTALQYGPTEGDTKLKKELIKHMKEEGINATTDNLLIVSASQQALDITSKVFLDRGDYVFVEVPTYVGGIQAFNSYGANMIPVESDNDGMIPEKLEEAIKKSIEEGQKKKLKLVYIIPDFQNPGGITTSLERRKGILEVANKFNLIVVEDSPYRQLRYSGESVSPMYALDDQERVISLFTFSKILTPGFRLGWIVGPKKIIEKFIIAKQPTDLCTSPFTQAIAREYLKRGYLNDQIKVIKKDYREKRDLMIENFKKEFPELEDLTWTKPDGGLFLWVTLPEYMNTRDLFQKAIEKKVAYVVGDAFHPKAQCKNSFRINFSYASKEQIVEGVKRLAAAIKEYDKELKESKDIDTAITP